MGITVRSSKPSMRKICKMHPRYLGSISKATQANAPSFVLSPPFPTFSLIPSLFWLQLPSPSSLSNRFLIWKDRIHSLSPPHSSAPWDPRMLANSTSPSHALDTVFKSTCDVDTIWRGSCSTSLPFSYPDNGSDSQLPAPILQGQFCFTVYFTKN